MGERWIDTKLYADLQLNFFETETSVMYFDVNDTYMVRLQSYSPVAYNTYFVRNYDGGDLFVHALHDTVPEITKEIYRNGDKVRVPDEEAIQEAATKIQEIRDRFNRWLDRQPIEVRDELVRCIMSVSTAMSGRTMTVRHKPFRSSLSSNFHTIASILTERCYLDD